MRLGKFIQTINPITEVVVPSIEPGTLMGGGHWGGRIQTGANQYDLIVSPNPMGGFYEDYNWSIEQREPYTYWEFDIEFNASTNDGYAIMQAAKEAGVGSFSPLAIYADITLNGFSDWYAPSLFEMEILYRNLKPTNSANNTSFGVNTSAVPPTSNYTSSVPTQTTYTPFRDGNPSQFREDIYFTPTRGLSGNKTTYATFSCVDGSIGEASNTDSNWSRAIRRQLVA